ncbi:MAG TPA: hypothetical protein VGL75_03665 [Acidothermaceae bacterium]
MSSPQAFSLPPSSPGSPLASSPGSGSLGASGPPVSSPPASIPPVSSPPAIASGASGASGVHGTVVVGGATPARMSISVSQALFTSAPTVVVASPTEAADVVSGATEAQQLDVPLLLLDHDDAAPADATPTPALFAAELTRLGTSTVVAIGSSAADVSAAAPSVSVVATAAQTAAATSSDGDDLTVLVPKGVNAASDAVATMASASAQAARATVVSVQGADPRRDPAAIAALAAHPPHNVLAVGTQFGTPQTVAARVAVASTGTQLPGGGQIFFPGRRLVALYGHPGGAALGVLGAQDLPSSIARVKQLAAVYAPMSSVPVVPTFEIIATVAQAAAGSDGNYSGESSVASLLPWVQAATAAGLYVVLDLQPGSANVLSQAKLYTSLLAMPDVGLAIDPEWALAPGQHPLGQIGSLTSAQINAVGAWLEQLTASKHLPQKLLVLHQFRLTMIGDEAALKTNYNDVAVLIHMDGEGSTPSKIATWNAVTHAAPKGVPFGWKNFYKEDHPTMTPEQTMAQKPTPVMISYQ